MPSFQGQVNEEQLLGLVAYIKSLSTAKQPVAPTAKPRRPDPQSANPVRSQ
jgi:hypothetical protein